MGDYRPGGCIIASLKPTPAERWPSGNPELLGCRLQWSRPGQHEAWVAKPDHTQMNSAVEAAIIGTLGGTAVGAFVTGVVAWYGGERQRKKEHLVVRKATYSACATALMTHYTALRSLTNESYALKENSSLSGERFNRLSALHTVAIQSVAAVMVEGPSRTAKVAEEAARALERSSKRLRRWIVSRESEPPPDLGNPYSYVEEFMELARYSLRYAPHDEEMDVASEHVKPISRTRQIRA